MIGALLLVCEPVERIRKFVGLSVAVLWVGQTVTGHINEAVLIMSLSWVLCCAVAVNVVWWTVS